MRLFASGLALVIFGLCSCTNTMTYGVYQPAHFKQNGWYIFEDFRYQGRIQDGQPNGRGTIVYSNGVVASGTFEDGVLEGEDVTIEVPGNGVYRGTARDGALVGGEVQFENGTYFRGAMNGLRPQGKGVMVTQRGDVYRGRVRDGKLDGAGSHYSADEQTTTYGTFEDGQIDGEALVENHRTGREQARIFEDGQDVTEETLREEARQEVDQSQKAELERLDREIEDAETKLNRQQKEHRRERESMTDRLDMLTSDCYCVLENCPTLTTFDGTYYERMYKGKERRIYAPEDLSEAEIMAWIRREVDTYDACLAKKRDPENFEENILREIDRRFSRVISRARNARVQAQAEKERALERQRRERQRRLREEREAVRSRLEARVRTRAQRRAEQREQVCAANPNACGCWTPERLQACAADKTTSCACNW